MFNVGEKVYWHDPNDGINSGEYWVTGKKGDILYLMSEQDHSEVEANSEDCENL